MLEHKDLRVRKEILEILERWDHLEYREHQVSLDSLDNRGYLDYQGIQDHREDKVIWGLLVLMEKME